MSTSSSAATQAPASVPGGNAPAPAQTSSGGVSTMAPLRATEAPVSTPSFEVPRLPPGAGYDQTPYAQVHLSYILPHFFRRLCRIQRVRYQSAHGLAESPAKLWVSNVEDRDDHAVPFFPGFVSSPIRDASCAHDITAPARSIAHRYSDGHLGPGDPCEHAQFYDAEHPYLAFVRRSGPDAASRYASYRPVLERGTCSYNPATGKYSAEPSFLAALREENQAREAEMLRLRPLTAAWVAVHRSRPAYPTPDDLGRLSQPATAAQYIDLVTHVQRGLRCKLAWVTMAQLLAEDHGRLPMDELRRRGPPDAHVEFLGSWINTAPEHDAWWLIIRGRVPAYVASGTHEENPQEAADLAAVIGSLPTRAVHPTVANSGLIATSGYVAPAPIIPPYATPDFASAKMQGWRQVPVLRHHVVDVPGFEHGWVQSPPVPPASTTRSRQVFMLGEDWEGNPCFLLRSKSKASSASSSKVATYDVEGGRKYWLKHVPQMHGLVDTHKFGFPLPRLPHYYTEHVNSSDASDYKSMQSGRWVYLEANPGERFAGQVALRPSHAPELDEETISLGDDDDDIYGSEWEGLPGVPARAPAASLSTPTVPPLASTDPATSSAPSAALTVPAVTRVASPMIVDPAPPYETLQEIEEAQREFEQWQTRFPLDSWRHEPHPRPSRLAPRPRGRFAHYVRIRPESDMSWAEVLRRLRDDVGLRDIEIDHIFQARLDHHNVFGVIVPASVLAETMVREINTRGLHHEPASARIMSAAEYSSLAEHSTPDRSWRRPPPPPRPPRSARRREDNWRARTPSPASSLRRSPGRRYRPPSLGRRRSPRRSRSPVFERRASPRRLSRRSRSPRRRRSTSSRRSRSPRRATPRSRRSPSPRRSRSLSRRSYSPRRTASPMQVDATRETDAPRGGEGGSGWGGASTWSPAPSTGFSVVDAPPSTLASSSVASRASSPAARRLPAVATPPLTAATNAAVGIASLPVSDELSDAQMLALIRMMRAFPGVNPTTLMQTILLTDADSTLPSSSSQPVASSSALAAATSSVSATAAPASPPTQTPGAGPSRLPPAAAGGSTSLMSRLSVSLADRLSDAPSAPGRSSGDRDDDDNEGASRPKRRRGGRRVRERVGKGKARDGEFDPKYPHGFRRRSPSPGAGGAGVV